MLKLSLVLANGEVEHIDENVDDTKLADERGNVIGTQQGNQLSIRSKRKPIHRKRYYNTINVPYGKKFTVAVGRWNDRYI